MHRLALLAMAAGCGRFDFDARGGRDASSGNGSDGEPDAGAPVDAYAGPNRVFVSTRRRPARWAG